MINYNKEHEEKNFKGMISEKIRLFLALSKSTSSKISVMLLIYLVIRLNPKYIAQKIFRKLETGYYSRL